MVLQLKQSLKLSQQLIMTPQLQQAIKLLQLNRLELLEAIHQELETNPVLEETTLEEEEPTPAREPDPAEQAEDKLLRDHTAPVEVKEKVHEQEEMDWEAYLGEYNSPYQAASGEREEREAVPLENILSAAPDLVDHLQWQLMLSDLSQEERRIGVEIIGNIKPSGYLDASLEEIAAECGSDLAQIEKVLKLIHLFDPVGVAARDLRECLLIQMAQQDLEDSLAWRIVDQGLDQLGNKNYRALAKRFGASLEEIAEAVDIISALDPKPGRAYSSERPQYITPDIYVIKVDDDYVIVLNEDGLPKLKVNSFYRRALTNAELVSDGTREFIQDKLRSAMWLIRSIHQRQRTIYKVTESIVKRQRQFLDQGIAYLKPMVLKDVAEDVEMHESTISRVTTNKYVHTPQGLFELKYFFNSAIQRFHGEALASESVKERIRQIVAAEDQDHPLSDDQIKKILEAENINIARRTVAKYREVLNILPSSKRRRPVLRSR